MIVVITVAKGNNSKSDVFGIFSDDSNRNGKINKQRTICGKLIGNGSVMENYARCG